MNDRLEIIVTQRCIDSGFRHEPKLCPVALALRAAAHREVSVSLMSVLVDGVRWPVTGELQAWIFNYDTGQPVYPERFVLEPEHTPAAVPLEPVAA